MICWIFNGPRIDSNAIFLLCYMSIPTQCLKYEPNLNFENVGFPKNFKSNTLTASFFKNYFSSNHFKSLGNLEL